jgi:hypothetical protein
VGLRISEIGADAMLYANILGVGMAIRRGLAALCLLG